MDIYFFEFTGRFLGGHAIVASSNKSEAVKMLNDRLEEESLKPLSEADIKRAEKMPTDFKTILDFYDGDY